MRDLPAARPRAVVGGPIADCRSRHPPDDEMNFPVGGRRRSRIVRESASGRPKPICATAVPNPTRTLARRRPDAVLRPLPRRRGVIHYIWYRATETLLNMG